VRVVCRVPVSGEKMEMMSLARDWKVVNYSYYLCTPRAARNQPQDKKLRQSAQRLRMAPT
jgi:hypothetical protein